MRRSHFIDCLLVVITIALTGCRQEESKNESVGAPPAGLAFYGSEVETNGVKTRLIGCSETDADCLKRNEVVAKLGCDWIGPEECKGCNKLDTACLVQAQAGAQ